MNEELTLTLRLMAKRTAAGQVLRARILDRLEALDITQKELSAKMGVSPAWVTDVMKWRRDVPVSKLDRLARALDVTVPFLFTESDLSRQGPPVQLPPSLVEGAPRDPAARASYFQEVISAYQQISHTLLRVAAEAVESSTAPDQPPASGPVARDRPTHRKRTRAITRPPKDRK